MNVKYYIRGLGVGLIIAASTLMITGAVTGDTDSNIMQQQTTEADSIIAYTTESPTKTQKTTAAKETANEIQTETTTAQNVNEDGTVQVIIHDVYAATTASDILFDAGVIKDKQEFTDYMTNNGYATKIREGIYSIVPGESYENIARTITGLK